jgi:hypothetical protein
MKTSEKIVVGLVSKLEKLKLIFKKINSESILNYLKKSPNICDKYEERLQIYNFFVLKYLIETMIKMVKIYEKLEKYKNNFNEKTIKMGYLTSKILQNSIISLTEKDKLFNEFMKKNKKALDELKNNDKKAYITFFVVRYPLECFVLP